MTIDVGLRSGNTRIVCRLSPGNKIRMTPEEIEGIRVCAHCDEVYKDHLADEACVFSPTMFQAKLITWFNPEKYERLNRNGC